MIIRFSVVIAVSMMIGWLPGQAAAWGGECKFSEDREEVLDARRISELRVRARAGELTITGESGRNDIVVTATVCASEKEWVDESKLIVNSDKRKAEVIADLPEPAEWKNNSYVRMDLELLVPDSLRLDVKDSSGPLRIENVGELELADSSGSINVEDITGNAVIKDSSGSLEVDRVSGDVTITDSSGSIDVNEVEGSVVIESDSSGGIEIEDVRQNVLVRRDSSGGIDVRRIGGDFIVERDGSGGISYRDVEGQVFLPEEKRRN